MNNIINKYKNYNNDINWSKILNYAEKNLSHEFKPSEIFNASDMMVDSLTQLLSRERKKKQKN